MKFKNLAINAKFSALFATMLIITACESNEQKIAKLDKEIAHLELQIDSIQTHNEITDSVSRNPVLQKLDKKIKHQTPDIVKLRERNKILIDSIQTHMVSRASQKYPLTKFLSNKDLADIREQLIYCHSEWNDKNAKNIIAGRGTLIDLYNVCFDLDYTEHEPPFHIINELGYVRFDNNELNKLCEQFEAEKIELENEEHTFRTQRGQNKKELARNQNTIAEFERMCITSDSIYLTIRNHFAPVVQHKTDSLINARNNLRIKREEIIKQIQSKQR